MFFFSILSLVNYTYVGQTNSPSTSDKRRNETY